jgi:hypothetical protein
MKQLIMKIVIANMIRKLTCNSTKASIFFLTVAITDAVNIDEESSLKTQEIVKIIKNFRITY